MNLVYVLFAVVVLMSSLGVFYVALWGPAKNTPQSKVLVGAAVAQLLMAAAALVFAFI